MATRPWITPQDVKDYSDILQIASRADKKLAIDIQKAEAWVITYTNNNFLDETLYPVIPEDVKTAVIMLAENYAANAIRSSKAGGVTVTSESFDEYSYSGKSKTEADLGLNVFLDQFKVYKPTGSVVVRLRKL